MGSSYFSRRNRRTGHLCQGRFKNFVIGEHSYWRQFMLYVHRNSLRAGLVGDPSDGSRPGTKTEPVSGGTGSEREAGADRFLWFNAPSCRGGRVKEAGTELYILRFLLRRGVRLGNCKM